MSVTISARYLGNKSVELTHEPSGAKITTDAPKDNNGLGRSFSPTDLFSASLPACMMTVMSIVAERDGIDLSGMHARIDKEMTENPRRVSRLPLTIHMPKTLTDEQRTKLERTARACPVTQSIGEQIKVDLKFIYDAI
jgi:putative redox protein